MKHLRLSQLAILLAAIGCATVPELTGVAGNQAYAQEAMRAEVGKLVQQAGELYKAKKYRDALGKLQETDRIGNKSVNETFTIERMRLSVASAAGDNDAVIRSGEIIVAANKLPNKDQLQLIQVLANSYFKANNYAKAAKMYERYFSEGGTDSSSRQYMIQAKSMSGDSAGALKETRAEIQAAEKAGRVPSQSTLETYAYAVQKSGDKAGYLATLEKLVMHYGKKEYWVNLLNSVERKPDFSSRLTMDLYRLKLAVGQISKTSDFMEMSQMAIQDGNAGEALKIIEQGYKSGALGTGNEAARHGRLKDLATKRVAEAKAAFATTESDAQKSADGTALVNLGFSLATGGEYEKGVGLMEQGIKKGSLKHPDDANLHLGVAHLLAGKKAAGLKAFKNVQGKDGSADLARFWTIYANQAK
ncbi:tetratricopeptide repeat protein [Undibacterium fentianense]|uniref:Tetratricopeptide repeat protein n=1 Tax=Undibacterium fentianense TaxID=2828728 RepID=A0A941DXJ0_9BURK|nr:tetratricopeptide repeat protein [Undibacterium fentianense]MBR7799269.1 tetratricopeptide repeat protein [Undibacterium fentianense]